MEFSIFGYQLKKQGPEPKKFSSPVAPSLDDGATINSGAAYYSTVLDIDGVIKGENDLIRRYRECAQYSDVDSAIEDIVNEAISSEDDEIAVELNLEDLKVSDGIKKKIEEEFDNIITLLKFDERSHEIFRQWYIDGRVYYNVIIDKDKPKEGIKELRYVDPRKIRKIKTIQKKKSEQGVDLVSVVEEYYLFNDKGVSESTTTGVKMSIDSVVYVPSGNYDANTGMALSFLNKAVKPTNQLKMLEDAMVIYRITRAPERRIFYIDVGNLPKLKAEQYVTDMMNKFKNKIVYDACLDMETSVPLLDGRTLSLRDIQTEFEAGKQLWAYSCDPISGKFAPGLISWAGVTKKDQKVIRITLDNGKTVTCTYDHKFPVWGKGKVEAKDLVVGESMVPFYTREKSVVKGKSSYQQIFQNETNKWEFTHRLVSAWKNENNIKNTWTFGEGFEESNKGTVHHKNYNRYDNTPDNLTLMNSKDHFGYHTQHNGLAGKIGGKVTAQRKRELGLPMFNMTHEEHINAGILGGRIGGTRAKELKVGWHNPEVQLRGAIAGSAALCEKLANDQEFNAKFCQALKNGWNEDNKAEASERGKSIPLEHFAMMGTLGNESKWNGINGEKNRKEHSELQSIIYPDAIYTIVGNCTLNRMSVTEAVEYINLNVDLSEFVSLNVNKKIRNRKSILPFTYKDLTKVSNSFGYSGFKEFKESFNYHNHKITKIEYLDETMDVGCLTIDRDETYHDHHTFALDIGIYTGNSTGEVRDDRKHMSMMEDFWMPRREGGKGTEITTLPGLQNTNNTEDVQYFQTKLFQALNVPISRNTPGGPFNVGRGSEITRDEIKFAKFVSRLRVKFGQLFYELMRIQLQIKGITTADAWIDMRPLIHLKYAKDNHFAEFKNNEIMTQRVNLLTVMAPFADQGYYSKPWIRKNVLMQTEDEIKQIDKEHEEEAANNPMPQDQQSAAPQAQEQPQ